MAERKEGKSMGDGKPILIKYEDVYTAPTEVIVTDELIADLPFRFGRIDALLGYPAVPEAVYIYPDSMVHYTLGYISVAGRNETTDQILAMYDDDSISKVLVPVNA